MLGVLSPQYYYEEQQEQPETKAIINSAPLTVTPAKEPLKGILKKAESAITPAQPTAPTASAQAAHIPAQKRPTPSEQTVVFLFGGAAQFDSTTLTGGSIERAVPVQALDPLDQQVPAKSEVIGNPMPLGTTVPLSKKEANGTRTQGQLKPLVLVKPAILVKYKKPLAGGNPGVLAEGSEEHPLAKTFPVGETGAEDRTAVRAGVAAPLVPSTLNESIQGHASEQVGRIITTSRNGGFSRQTFLERTAPHTTAQRAALSTEITPAGELTKKQVNALSKLLDGSYIGGSNHPKGAAKLLFITRLLLNYALLVETGGDFQQEKEKLLKKCQHDLGEFAGSSLKTLSEWADFIIRQYDIERQEKAIPSSALAEKTTLLPQNAEMPKRPAPVQPSLFTTVQGSTVTKGAATLGMSAKRTVFPFPEANKVQLKTLAAKQPTESSTILITRQGVPSAPLKEPKGGVRLLVETFNQKAQESMAVGRLLVARKK